MENNEKISPDTNPNKTEGIKIKLDEKYSNLFGIETAILYNQDPKPGTIRVYRGINNFTADSLENQTSNMMRFIDQNRDIGINREIGEIVETLASNPTAENYQNVVNESKKLKLNNYIIKEPLDFYGNFKMNLITQHRNAIRNNTGSSPWVSASTNPIEAFYSTGVSFGAILIIDIPKDRITTDKNTDENEILINGYIKKEEISAVLLVDKSKIKNTLIDEEELQEITNLIKELDNHLN